MNPGSLRPGEWYRKYGTASAARAKSVEPDMMMGGAGQRDEEEIDGLMSQLEVEIAKKRKLQEEIARCKQTLMQNAIESSRTKRRQGRGTDFGTLTFGRARGAQRVKLSGLYPQIKNPASYRLDML